MPYRAPLSDYAFLLDHILGYDRLAATPRFNAIPRDTATAILAEAARLAEDVAELQAGLADGRIIDPERRVRMSDYSYDVVRSMRSIIAHRYSPAAPAIRRLA